MNPATCFADAVKISLTPGWKPHLIKLKYFVKSLSLLQGETRHCAFHGHGEAIRKNKTLE